MVEVGNDWTYIYIYIYAYGRVSIAMIAWAVWFPDIVLLFHKEMLFGVILEYDDSAIILEAQKRENHGVGVVHILSLVGGTLIDYLWVAVQRDYWFERAATSPLFCFSLADLC